MTKQEIKELLEKQLQLLSEQSKNCTGNDLWSATNVMSSLVYLLFDERIGLQEKS